MDFPGGTMPALYGAAAGAIAATALGFMVLGWTTAGTAQQNVDDASSSAVLAIMTPYCVARAGEADAAAVIAELKGTSNFGAQRAMIEKAGWATPPGADDPVKAAADACLRTISAGF